MLLKLPPFKLLSVSNYATIDNSDVFSCSFLWPDSFKKKNEKKFAFLRNTAASMTTNRHDETRLQIHVVNLAFKEVAGNSYLMSSLNSHLHFIVSVVWFESTYHFLSIFKWRFVGQSVASWKKVACVAWYSVLQVRPSLNKLTQTHLSRLTKFFLQRKMFYYYRRMMQKELLPTGYEEMGFVV